MSDISLFEAMRTQRSIRRYANDPVPDELITTIIEAATHAPSATNRQPWHFLVIRDGELKRRMGEWYLDAWSSIYPNVDPRTLPQSSRSGVELGRGMVDVPALILVCLDISRERSSTPSLIYGASIYPVVQNIMLAARALGLGTVLTTIHRKHELEIKQLLGIPANVETVALIPLGYPAEGERFGGGKRKPVDEVTSYDRWGQRAP